MIQARRVFPFFFRLTVKRNMASSRLEDVWDSPFISNSPPPTPKKSLVASRRASAETDDAKEVKKKQTDELMLEEMRNMRNEISQLSKVIAMMREERTRQSHAIIFVLGLQAFFLFMYLDRLHRQTRVK